MNRRLPPLHGLTYLRFFAAMQVLLLHVLIGWDYLPRAVQNVINSGYVGVTFFFVLSGFILAYNYVGRAESGKLETRSFWIQRIARIYPAYAVALLFSLPIYIQYSVDKRGLIGALPRMIGAAIFKVLMLHSWLFVNPRGWNGPDWSLSAEAFFYAIFPFLIVWVVKMPAERRWRVALLGLGGSFAITMAYCLIMPKGMMPSLGTKDDVADILSMNPLVRCFEFIFGVAIGTHFLKHAPTVPTGSKLGPTLALAGLAVALIVEANVDYIPYILMHNSLLILPFAALIYGVGLMGYQADEAQPRWPFLLLLGEASYSLYIFHVPVKDYFLMVVAPLGMRQLSLEFVTIFAVMMIGISILSYKFIEIPGRRLIREWSERRKAATPVAAK